MPANDRLKLARDAYGAYESGDRRAIEELLANDFTFYSPADPSVMEHLPALLTRAESDGLIARIEDGFDERGYGLWALELRATGELVGFAGLEVPSFAAHFTGCRDRLAPGQIGQGPGLRHRGRQGLARIRVRAGRHRRDRLVYEHRERPLAGRDETARDDPQPRRRLRSP